MTRGRFTRRQRLVLTALGTAVVVVFAMLGYAVATTPRGGPFPAIAPPTPTTTRSPGVTPSPSLPPTSTSPPSPTPSPTSAATPTRGVPLSQIQSARAVHEVGRILASVRELPAVEQIAVTFPTEHEVAVFLLQKYQEDPPQADLPVYAALGLIPRLDPLPLPDVTTQADHVSSLYLPAGQQILLVAGRGPATPDDELALVHALAHALQDRAFGLEGLLPCRPTTDSALALQALIEGDAVLTTAHYANAAQDSAAMDHLGRMAADAEEPTYAPLADSALFDLLRAFPYVQGARWAAALQEAGGWDALDRAYARVPCSTEQILHPERYVDDEPVEDPTIPDLQSILGEGWRLVQEDTLGEWLLGLHLAAYLDDDALAEQAAGGWAGDRFALWEGPDGEQVLVWRTVWDSRDEAVEFERTYRLLIPRFRTPPPVSIEDLLRLPGDLWAGPAGAAYLVRTGRIATVVWGPNLEIVQAVARVLP